MSYSRRSRPEDEEVGHQHQEGRRGRSRTYSSERDRSRSRSRSYSPYYRRRGRLELFSSARILIVKDVKVVEIQVLHSDDEKISYG
ncbi:hypothetical protein L2E82_31105 [Cichorium intybus]|uniref:Uncharacterized protein n=1 Tax=Cichorium intybus TaxID=13427 RepID=A0ACB9D2C4_CICIN|nr:hypothetical protein L2E82_31105 [Cichorium intybus]